MANNTNPDKVYWDSCTYLHFLQGDHERHEQMQMVMEDWKSGAVRVFTSALTIAEVLWIKCEDDQARMMIDRSRDAEIIALFEPPKDQLFTLVEVSRVIATAARELVWDHGIKPKDAIHVVSALAAHCPVLHSNDGPLCKFSGKVGGTPVLRIEPPTWSRQIVFELPEPDDEPPKMLPSPGPSA